MLPPCSSAVCGINFASPRLRQLNLISSLVLAGELSGMTTLALPPPRTLVVVPASLVVSTSSLLWPRQRLCRLNGSAPFSLVTLSGPPLFNTSCANNLEVRFFWPPPCVSTPFGGILFAGGPSYKPGRNFVLTGILTLRLGQSPRHCPLFLRARTLPVTYLVFLWCSCSSPIRPVPILRLFRTPPLAFVLAGKLLVGSVTLLTIFATPVLFCCPTCPFRLLSPSPSSPPYFHGRPFPASSSC